MSEEKFDWPCDRRVAHRSHYIQEEQRLCEGVKAHPKTMIGGAQRRESK